MNIVNYTCSFPITRTAICASLGYCTAKHLDMPPALGASTAAIIDKIFEFALPSDKISVSEQNKAINGAITQITGIGLGSIFADGLFPQSSLSSSLSSLSKLSCIFVTSKVVQYVATCKITQALTQFIPLPRASLIRHNFVRYPLQAIASIFALNVLHNNSLNIPRDEREVVIFFVTFATMATVAISDIAYPIFQRYFPSTDEDSTVQTTVREKDHQSPIPFTDSRDSLISNTNA